MDNESEYRERYALPLRVRKQWREVFRITATETAVPERSFRHDLCSVCGDKAGAAAVDNTDGWRWFNDGKGGLLPLCSTCAVPEDLLESIPPGTSGATKPESPGRVAWRARMARQ